MFLFFGNFLGKFLGKALILSAFGILLSCAVIGFIFFQYGRELPEYRFLNSYVPPVTTYFYASNGKVIKEYFSQNRTFRSIDQIPDELICAFLAAEDKNFFNHFGLDFMGVARAFIVNTTKGWQGRPMGASTITQQVAKNMFVGNEKSVGRKLREAVMAVRLEMQMNKMRLLEIYLNEVYLGRGAYGVAAAARAYFAKDICNLSLEECAFIAALAKAPTNYNLSHNFPKIKNRRDWVLSRMHKAGFINIDYCNHSRAQPIKILSQRFDKSFARDSGSYYFADEVKRQLLHSPLFKGLNIKGLTGSGLSVVTTMDTNLQKIAHQSLRQGLLRYSDANKSLDNKGTKQSISEKNSPEVTGGIVVMEAETGRVLALSGGFDFEQNSFNCATQAWRQPGSAFKPIVYLAALESESYTIDSLVMDKPLRIYLGGNLGYYKPKNYNDDYAGLCSFRRGMEQSRNCMTVSIARKVGLKKIRDLALKLGVVNALPRQLSVALGSKETTLLRLTRAYCTMVNGGIAVKPTFVSFINDRSNSTIFECEGFKSTDYDNKVQVISPESSNLITEMLRGVVRRGTARKLNYLIEEHNIDIGGKTGTTNNSNDAWFVGFIKRPNHPTLVVGVFVGFAKPKSLGETATGGTMAVPVFDMFVNHLIKSCSQNLKA